MAGEYTSLHTHTQYSLKDAISRPRAMMSHLKNIGQDTVGITDHGVMYSIAEYLKVAKEYGIKLIAGCEFYVANQGIDERTERDTYHLTVLALDKQGYHNLMALHDISYRQGFYYDPRIDLEVLHRHRSGLVGLSGCLGGALPKAILKHGERFAEARLKELLGVFDKGAFYIELQNHRIEEQLNIEPVLRDFSKRFRAPLVATNDSHYVEEQDWVPHDAMICLGTGMNLQMPKAMRKVVYEPREFRLKTYDEMAERFEDKVLLESFKIGELAEPLDLSSKTFHIPKVAKDSTKMLRDFVEAGIKVRYSKVTQQVRQRVDFELAAIEKGGFVDYLLIIADVYDFMRAEDIPFGFGRGSAAGSICCYALGITDVDPLRFNLLFERFINPDRISMPDIDCDISQERRQEVIDYVKEKYGENRVAQIITYQTLGGRAVVRDMARVLCKERDLGDKIAKLIPKEGSVTVDRELRHYLADAVRDIPELKKLYANDANAREIIDLGKPLEGVPKSESVHASGVVISDKDLSELVPMTTIKPADKAKAAKGRVYAVGYDMRQIEDIGLIKFDFLGLRNVDIVQECLDLMKREKVVPKNFDKLDIPLDDKATFDLLSRGLTAGVFQLESGGMRKYLKELKPERVDDVIAMVALYRPGPMEFIPDYIARKNGAQEVTYPHPSLKTILEPTYGLVVYQEQIMQVGEIIAGWSKGRADQLRKVIGKKIIDKIEAEKTEFVHDAVAQGHQRAWATGLFEDFIEPAARYAFNLSHAAAYGLLSYITAYLKANYPTYYFGALLASVQDKQDRVTGYIADARALGISVLPPCVSSSDQYFTAIPEDNAVRFGLSAIKNVGVQAVNVILRERKKGPFVDLFDFVERTKNTLINSRTLTSLILAGAMDGLPGTRDEKAASVDTAIKRVDMLAEDRRRIAEGRAAVKRKVPIPDPILTRPDGVRSEEELLACERDLLGTYLSGHPFHNYAKEARKAASVDLAGLQEMENEQAAVICGIVTAIREHTTKKSKKRMLFVTVEDDTTAVEVTVFPKTAKDYGDLFQLDKPVVIRGNVDIQEDDEDAAVDVDDETGSTFQRSRDVKFLAKKVSALKEAASVRQEVDRPSRPKREPSALFVNVTYENYVSEIENAKHKAVTEEFDMVIFNLPNDTQVRLELAS